MASASLGRLTLDLVAKIGGFEQGMDRAARHADRRMRDIQRNAQRVTRAINSAFALIGTGLSVRAILNATIEQEKAIAQLEARIASTGGVAGVTSQEMQQFASELQRVTTFGDETILQMQSLLLTFTNIRGETVRGATRSILDVATALGTDLNSAAKLVGRALNDPVQGLSALSRAGIVFNQQQKETIRQLVETNRLAEAQALILRELETRFGGSAQAARNTLGGALAGLKNAFGDLLEADGGGVNNLTGAINSLTDLLNKPATKTAFDNFTAFLVNSLGAAIGLTVAIAELTSRTAEDIGVAFGGEDPLNLGRFEQQIKNIFDELQRIDQQIARDGTNIFLENRRKELEQSIAEWERLLLNARAVFGDEEFKRNVSVLITPQIGPSAGFNELLDKLDEAEEKYRKQLAAVKELTEVEKLRFQIASGELAGLTEEEQQLAFARAEQLDILNVQIAQTKEFFNQQNQLAKSYESQLANLQREIALVGVVDQVSRLRYETEQGNLAGLNELQKERLLLLAEELQERQVAFEREQAATAAATARFNEEQSRVKAIIAETRTETERYIEKMTELNALLEKGAIDSETAGRAAQKWADEWRAAMESLNTNVQNTMFNVETFGEQAARNIQSAFADFLFNPFEQGLQGMLYGFIRTLQRMIAEVLAAQILKQLFGGFAGQGGFLGALGSAFGGGRATGGPVSPGTAYIVGEKGPELFMPSSAGNIVPNDKMGGEVNIKNINVLDPSLVGEYLATDAGEQMIMNVIQRNRSVFAF